MHWPSRFSTIPTALIFILLIGLPSLALAGYEVSYTKIVDEDTPRPDAPGEFFTGTFPRRDAAIDGNRVAFVYNRTSTKSILYLYQDGVISLIADENDCIPGCWDPVHQVCDQKFEAFAAPCLHNEGEVWGGSGDDVFNSDYGGLYRLNHSVIYDFRTPSPDGGYSDYFGCDPHTDGDDIVFLDYLTGGPVTRGIYAVIDGVLQTVVNDTMTIPNTSEHFYISTALGKSHFISNQEVVFGNGATGHHYGVYRWSVAGIEVVLDETMDVPGFGVPATYLLVHGFDDSEILLEADWPGSQGLILVRDDVFELIAQNGDPIFPGGEITYLKFFKERALDAGNVVFRCNPGGVQKPVIFYTNGKLIRVIECGDVLDGREIQQVWLGGETNSLSGNRILLWIQFTDGGQSFYVATITETPSGVDDADRDEQRLLTCGPNPASSETEIQYHVPRSGPVRLAIYDMAGRRIRSLVDEGCESGHYTAAWDARDDSGRRVPSGVYFCRLETGRHRETGRLVLLK